MSVKDIQIKAKKISELNKLEDEEKIGNSYIVVSYTENGAKENYKVKIQDLINNAANSKVNDEYSIYVYANGATLVSQSAGPYLKDQIVTLKFSASTNYQLTEQSPFLVNCDMIEWLPQHGLLKFKINGTGNPIIHINADSLLTYIVNYSGLENMRVVISKLSFRKNEEFNMNLYPNNGYELPNSINDFSISGGTFISYNRSQGILRIKVIENIIITGSAIEKPKYNVDINIVNSTYSINPNKLSFYKDDQFEITITPNKGYIVPSQLIVNNGTLLSYSNNKAIIKVDGTGDLSIGGSSENIEYPLSLTLTHLTATIYPNKNSYHINDDITIIFTPDNGYILPTRNIISIYGATIQSYTNGELHIKVNGNNPTIRLTVSAPVQPVTYTYYFGMTYAGEGYFNDKTISYESASLHIFNEENTLISIDSPYISSSTNVSPIPYNNFNITNNYQNVKYIPKFTFIAMIVPKKYVEISGDTYLFLDDSNNKYKIQQLGIDITNFEQLKSIYANTNIDWEIEVSINGIPHYIIYFKDEGTAGTYQFVKIS